MSDHEMICTCQPDGHAAAEQLRLEVQARLGVRDTQLSTAVVLSLAWQLGAEITVFCDQWFGVQVVLGNDGGSAEFVACDWPLDGLVYLWKFYADKWPDIFALTGTEHDNTATRATSATQLEAEMRAERAWADHRAACVLGCSGDDWKPCAEGKVLWDATIAMSSLVDDKWGMPKNADAFFGQR